MKQGKKLRLFCVVLTIFGVGLLAATNFQFDTGTPDDPDSVDAKSNITSVAPLVERSKEHPGEISEMTRLAAASSEGSFRGVRQSIDFNFYLPPSRSRLNPGDDVIAQ